VCQNGRIVFKIGKTFSSTKSDLQVVSSLGAPKVPIVTSGVFFFRSFNHGTFGEVATVAYALMVVILDLKLNQRVDLLSCLH
jgi:hypothetical protein